MRLAAESKEGMIVGGGGQVFTPAKASSILQMSGPCGVACDDAGHLSILEWER